jgi:hypothetical protein
MRGDRVASQGRARLGGWRHLLLLAAICCALLVQPQSAQGAVQWYSPVNVTPSDATHFDGKVVVDGSGQATAVWLRSAGSQTRVQAALRPAGQLSFGATQTVTPGSEDASEADVAVNAAGEAIIVWTRAADGVIRFARRAVGASVFGSATSISTANSFNPKIAIDPAGNAHAIWVRAVGASTVIESASKTPAGAFGTVETVSDPTKTSDEPQVEAEGGADALAVWTLFDATVPAIQTSARRELNYPRPGGGSPLYVPLVPEFQQCTSPNSTHVAPLGNPSCAPPVLASSLLTMGAVGAGSGSARYDAMAGDPGTPADEADISITARVTDVRCTAGGVPGCAAAGDDYTGQTILTSNVRQTDLSNGGFQDDPGTVSDYTLSFPMGCAVNPLSTVGATCSIAASADALIPGFVTERKRTIMNLTSVNVRDAGADGSLTPVSGACPPTCGSGDEAVFVRQGVFAP